MELNEEVTLRVLECISMAVRKQLLICVVEAVAFVHWSSVNHDVRNAKTLPKVSAVLQNSTTVIIFSNNLQFPLSFKKFRPVQSWGEHGGMVLYSGHASWR